MSWIIDAIMSNSEEILNIDDNDEIIDIKPQLSLNTNNEYNDSNLYSERLRPLNKSPNKSLFDDYKNTAINSVSSALDKLSTLRKYLQNIKWIKFADDAMIPKRGTSFSAGYDLYSAEDTVISASSYKCIKTNIGVIIPKGYYGRIAPRSGLAFKYGIDVLAGVIDADYRNAIGIILNNEGPFEFKINKGDRIAQIIFERCLGEDEVMVSSFSVEDAKKLPEWNTERNLGGFGSTGTQ